MFRSMCCHNSWGSVCDAHLDYFKTPKVANNTLTLLF